MTQRSYNENNRAAAASSAARTDSWQSGVPLIDVSLHGRFDLAVAFCRQNRREEKGKPNEQNSCTKRKFKTH